MPDSPRDYGKMTVSELEREISEIIELEGRPELLYRLAVFMGQLDFAKHIYHDKKYSPHTRPYKGGDRSAEVTSFGQALVQLLLLIKTRGLDFDEVFSHGIEHLREGEWRQRSPGGSAIRGLPVSGGRVSGKAFVIQGSGRIEDAPEGSIAVMEHADSQISHHIRAFRAVVSDQGGRLSHLAVVAREAGIPAVIGTGNATSLIKTGDEIMVDADSGRVEIARKDSA
jgi:phosphohistidine swiveling domain-containing protein